MSEYIKKDELLSHVVIEELSDYKDCEVIHLDAVDKCKTYSFPEREKGEWIVREDNTSFVKQLPRRWVECPCCGWSFSYDRIRDEFCSKCGADMRGKDNDTI